MSVTDELLENNKRYAEGFDKGDLPLPPAQGVAVVACMDARLHVSKILGLGEGDAHIIRNAGGVVTDDEIRSLAIDIDLDYRVRVGSFRFGLTPRVDRSTLAPVPRVDRSIPVRRAGSTCFWEYSQADRQVEAAAGAAATEVSQP